jgi:hydrogenase/urease accessory protein HupE
MRHQSSRLGLVVVAIVLMGGSAIHAHEIGTSRVSVQFNADRTYDVEIVTDATALAEKLETTAGRTLKADAPPDRLQALLAAADENFRRRFALTFDDAAARPTIGYAVLPAIDSASAPAATIRLTGEIPPGAQRFTWRYGWTFASYALTIRTTASDAPADGRITVWLDGGETSAPFALTAPAPVATRLDIAWRYLVLGFTHIVPKGFDHVLFVLGIYLLSRRARSVLWQVSAFTVAHSITLGLSMYGLVTVTPRVVEPLIAVSIAYVAIENVFLAELKSWRVGLVFAFGLLHGLGFAGALKELGLPRSEFVTALLTFNAGVEMGQLAVIGAAFLLVGWHCANRDWYRSRIVVPASMAIAVTAVYWTIERLFS